MDDRGANIDIVFRNGFKDYEVLPPPEVWGNIQPIIRKKPGYLLLFRRAAMIIVLLSIGYLVYWLGGEMPVLSENQFNNDQVQYFEIPAGIASVNLAINDSDNQSLTTLVPTGEKTSRKVIQNNPDVITPLPVISSEVEVVSSQPDYLHTQSDKANVEIPEDGIFLAKDLYGQSIIPENIPIKMPKRWSVAALASPTYFSQFSSGKDEMAKQMIASEQPIISYSGGLALSYKINKRISIQSGIYYSSVGQEVAGISSYSGFQQFDNSKGSRNFDVLTSSGTVYTNTADVFLKDRTGNRVLTQFTEDVFDPGKASLPYLNNTLKQNFSYLELPLVLRYKFIDRTLDMNFIGGVSYNFLVNNSVYTVIDGGRYPIGKTEGLSIMTFSSSIGMGMEYSFAKNVSFSLEPTFRYYLSPLNEVTGIKIHPYSFGVFSGFSFKF
jgi:hypothetical protein